MRLLPKQPIPGFAVGMIIWSVSIMPIHYINISEAEKLLYAVVLLFGIAIFIIYYYVNKEE